MAAIAEPHHDERRYGTAGPDGLYTVSPVTGGTGGNNNRNPSSDDSTRVVEHNTFDLKKMPKSDFELQTQWWQFYLNTFVMMYVLFNGVITLMGLAWGYLKAVTDGSNTGAVLYIAVYGPLVFFLLYFLVFNNFYSEYVYYMYMKRGAVLDFPQSAKPKYWLRSPIPFVFVTFLGAYLIFMFWYSQQSIESRFISISNYISCFPPKDGKREYGKIDGSNMSNAGNTLQKATLVKTHAASYSGYMANWYWTKERKWAPWVRALMWFLWLALIFIIAAIALSFFQSDMSDAESKSWRDMVNPCLEVCRNSGRTACDCMDACKKAAHQESNSACRSAASDFYKNATCC
jgi:hypothetical protein